MALDNAQTVNQPQATDPSEKMYTMMVAGLREHIFSKGEKGIVQTMKEADDVGRVLGEITFSLLREAAEQAKQQKLELEYEVLLGVATEVIDDIVELMAGHGMQIEDRDKEAALMVAQQLYVETYQPTEGERAQAKQDLAGMKEDGSMDQAVSHIQKRGMESGQDPFGVQEMGPERPGMMGRGQQG